MFLWHFRWVLIAFFCGSAILNAQQNDHELLKTSEDSCVIYFKQIGMATSDEEKLALNEKIFSEFTKTLSLARSFEYSFDSLKTIGRLYAPDKSFRIITWNFLLDNGNYKHFGIIQVPDVKTNAIKLFTLKDRSEEITNPENSVLSAGKWFGGLYYKALRNKVDNQTYYTLLALQYHNLSITRKIIEVLFFDSWGNPVFGAPIIQVGKKIKHRIVMEYSASSVVNLKYDEKLKMVVFDHLAPAEAKYEGIYEYYGPDLTFDGLIFKKDKWQYTNNLDLRRPTQSTLSPRPRR
jgi:hypothetical protein